MSSTHQEPTTPSVVQLRLVIEVDDFDTAVAFYRDQLGLAEEFFVDSGDDARVIALQAGRATLELITPAQRRLIDNLEVGHAVSPPIRVAFEVTDVDDAAANAVAGGAEEVADAVETPWGSRNARLNGPGPIHFTLFEELGQTSTEGPVATTDDDADSGLGTRVT